MAETRKKPCDGSTFPTFFSCHFPNERLERKNLQSVLHFGVIVINILNPTPFSSGFFKGTFRQDGLDPARVSG